MPRLFTEKENIYGNEIKLTGDTPKHLQVLREKPGNQVVICDGQGTDYICTISKMSKAEVLLKVINSYPSYTEPELKVTLYQGLPKSGKMDMIIQKCVELGVAEIVPVETEFSVGRISERSSRKNERWRKISQSAAEQCGRGIIPAVRETVTFKEAVRLAVDKNDANLVAYEREEGNGLAQSFKGTSGDRVGIFIGPEGGFSKNEIDLCIDNGIKPVSLGKRILRTETAGFMALILLLFIREEL